MWKSWASFLHRKQFACSVEQFQAHLVHKTKGDNYPREVNLHASAVVTSSARFVYKFRIYLRTLDQNKNLYMPHLSQRPEWKQLIAFLAVKFRKFEIFCSFAVLVPRPLTVNVADDVFETGKG